MTLQALLPRLSDLAALEESMYRYVTKERLAVISKCTDASTSAIAPTLANTLSGRTLTVGALSQQRYKYMAAFEQCLREMSGPDYYLPNVSIVSVLGKPVAEAGSPQYVADSMRAANGASSTEKPSSRAHGFCKVILGTQQKGRHHRPFHLGFMDLGRSLSRLSEVVGEKTVNLAAKQER